MLLLPVLLCVCVCVCASVCACVRFHLDNHRVHLSSPDMPSMHLCDVANGFAMLGYYM
eukprot:COSAG06_NODE_6911_length_2720_cov_14.787867_3_plen_58_part_00